MQVFICYCYDLFSSVGSRSNESVVDNEGSGNSVEGGSGVGNESGRVSNSELYCLCHLPCKLLSCPHV